MWKDWAEWYNWQKSQGNSHQQTRNQLVTPRGANNFLREAQILHRTHVRENGYAYHMSKTFFQGRKTFLQGGKALPLVTGLVTRLLGMQTSHCRLDWYMGMCSQRLFVFLDILKSSLVGLDNSAWEFDWCLKRLLDNLCLDNRKGTQQHAGADNGRLKGQILHQSAVKIYCKSFFDVAYVNFGQTLFATVRGYQQIFG